LLQLFMLSFLGCVTTQKSDSDDNMVEKIKKMLSLIISV